ncbi:hypothetical protein F2P56_027086, partial [Juglans regia]
TILIFCICTCIYLRIRKQRKKVEMDKINSTESLQFDFSTIRVATDNFSDVNKLGQGGFGTVYKGKFPNGQEIAVKRFSRSSKQGDQEFKNEILLVARLQHRNLVRLLGFCFEGLPSIEAIKQDSENDEGKMESSRNGENRSGEEFEIEMEAMEEEDRKLEEQREPRWRRTITRNDDHEGSEKMKAMVEMWRETSKVKEEKEANDENERGE